VGKTLISFVVILSQQGTRFANIGQSCGIEIDGNHGDEMIVTGYNAGFNFLFPF